MSDTRLVYSTESGSVCYKCEKSTDICSCKNKKDSGRINSSSRVVEVRREVKGRNGKTVTSVSGIPLSGEKLKQFAKKLKTRCGTGGTVKDGIILIQGDKREILVGEIKKQGYTVKLAGG